MIRTLWQKLLLWYIYFGNKKFRSVFLGKKNPWPKQAQSNLYALKRLCMLNEFYKFIRKQENFSYINGKNVLHLKIADIVWRFICKDETNYKTLRENLRKSKNIFQYLYSMVCPDVYYNIKRCGFDLKSEFQIRVEEY